MNRYLAFLFLFFVIGYVVINSTIMFSIVISDMEFYLETLFNDYYYYHHYQSNNNNNNYYYSHVNKPLVFDYVPLANAQEQKEEEKGASNDDNDDNNNDKNDKYVILMFDRGYKTTFTEVKPILDKYGFKATMFIACDYIEGGKGMSWDQVKELYNNGYDIQSHGLEHERLTEIESANEIESIVSGGKECLEEKSFSPTIFQAPYNKGGDDPEIVDIISKHFDFAFTGHAELMFLNCDGYENFDYGKEEYKGSTDCRPYLSDDDLAPTSKYGIKEWSHDRERKKIYDGKYPNKDPHSKKVDKAVLKLFTKIVESQTEFNIDGEINAIPIIGYHQIGTGEDFDPSVELFEQEMKYLYDNDYNVITLAHLGYDEDKERFYIKNLDK